MKISTPLWALCALISCAFVACDSSSDDADAGSEEGAAGGDRDAGATGDRGSSDGDGSPDGGSGVDAGFGLPTGVRDGRPDTALDGGTGTGDGDGDTGDTGDGDGDTGDGDTGDGDGDTGDGDGDSTPVIDGARCEIGVADAVTGLFFAPFPENGTIPMIGTGQADLIIDLALLVFEADEPDIEVVVEVDETGATSSFTSQGETGFVCASDGWCELLPVLIDTLPLVEDPFDLKELPVTVTLTVSDATGPYCQTFLSAPLLRRE